jgi:hypothetical protein
MGAVHVTVGVSDLRLQKLARDVDPCEYERLATGAVLVG